jgi:hypothetical protein
VASRRNIGRSSLNRNTGQMPAVTLVTRVDLLSALPAVIQQVHRRAPIDPTQMLVGCPDLLSGGPSPRDEILPYMPSIHRRVHRWLRSQMTVDSSVDSYYLSPPTWERSVLALHLPILRHDTSQQTVTPSTTMISDQRAQGCQRIIQSPPQSSPLQQYPSLP